MGDTEAEAEYADATLVRPVSALGSRYVVVAPLITHDIHQIQGDQHTFFQITAPRTNTYIHVQLSVDLHEDKCSWSSAVAWNFTQDQPIDLGSTSTTTIHALTTGENSAVYCEYSGDLTGTQIRSVAGVPIAVSSGVARGAMGSLGSAGERVDHLWEQLPPVEQWGQQYILFPTPEAGDSGEAGAFQIVSWEDNTTYLLNNVTTRLSQTSSWSTRGVDGYTLLVSDKPVMVVKTLKGSTTLKGSCMLALTSNDHWATTLTFADPDIAMWLEEAYTFYVTVITRIADTTDILIDGSRPSITWTQVNTLHFVILAKMVELVAAAEAAEAVTWMAAEAVVAAAAVITAAAVVVAATAIIAAAAVVIAAAVAAAAAVVLLLAAVVTAGAAAAAVVAMVAVAAVAVAAAAAVAAAVVVTAPAPAVIAAAAAAAVVTAATAVAAAAGAIAAAAAAIVVVAAATVAAAVVAEAAVITATVVVSTAAAAAAAVVVVIVSAAAAVVVVAAAAAAVVVVVVVAATAAAAAATALVVVSAAAVVVVVVAAAAAVLAATAIVV